MISQFDGFDQENGDGEGKEEDEEEEVDKSAFQEDGEEGGEEDDGGGSGVGWVLRFPISSSWCLLTCST